MRAPRTRDPWDKIRLGRERWFVVSHRVMARRPVRALFTMTLLGLLLYLLPPYFDLGIPPEWSDRISAGTLLLSIALSLVSVTYGVLDVLTVRTDGYPIRPEFFLDSLRDKARREPGPFTFVFTTLPLRMNRLAGKEAEEERARRKAMGWREESDLTRLRSIIKEELLDQDRYNAFFMQPSGMPTVRTALRNDILDLLDQFARTGADVPRNGYIQVADYDPEDELGYGKAILLQGVTHLRRPPIDDALSPDFQKKVDALQGDPHAPAESWGAVHAEFESVLRREAKENRPLPPWELAGLTIHDSPEEVREKLASQFLVTKMFIVTRYVNAEREAFARVSVIENKERIVEAMVKLVMSQWRAALAAERKVASFRVSADGVQAELRAGEHQREGPMRHDEEEAQDAAKANEVEKVRAEAKTLVEEIFDEHWTRVTDTGHLSEADISLLERNRLDPADVALLEGLAGVRRIPVQEAAKAQVVEELHLAEGRGATAVRIAALRDAHPDRREVERIVAPLGESAGPRVRSAIEERSNRLSGIERRLLRFAVRFNANSWIDDLRTNAFWAGCATAATLALGLVFSWPDAPGLAARVGGSVLLASNVVGTLALGGITWWLALKESMAFPFRLEGTDTLSPSAWGKLWAGARHVALTFWEGRWPFLGYALGAFAFVWLADRADVALALLQRAATFLAGMGGGG